MLRPPGGDPSGDRESRRRVTIRDVAARAGVHPSTVSRVLNGDDRRAVPETRERIHQAARDLGWRANSIARSLSTGRTRTIGMIIPTITNPAYAGMIQGAQRRAEERGNVVLVTDAGDDENRARMQIERLGDRVDGFVLGTARLSSPILPILDDRGVPFVLLNRRSHNGLPAVIGDDERGVRLAVEHLVELGHRRIGHISGPADLDTVERRRHAFSAAVRDLGMDTDRQLVRRGPLTPAGVSRSLRPLLQMPPQRRPTAVFCTNLLTAVEVIAAVTRAGLHVPADMSVVGFDDWPLAEHLQVPLTTVRMPTDAMGARAVELLLDRLDGKQIPVETRVAVPPRLIVRSSTAPPRPER